MFVQFSWGPLLTKMFESSRVRSVKSTPAKKVNEKSRSSTEKSSTSQTSNNTFFDSLKRVQGALSPASKSKSTSRQDVKRSRPISEVPAKYSDKLKDKDKDRTKDKEKDKEKEKRSWFRSPSRSSVKKEVTKSSISLNASGSAQKLIQKKRPLSAFPESNITHRRGQATKIEGHTLGDNLSRASSVTNLDADPKSAKGARPRKSSSRERLDKIGGDGRKHDKKGITRNNNKLESEENTHFSVDSFTEEELLILRRQLQDMAQEKTNLALQLGEQKGQLNILQKEIQKLKEESNMQLEHLTEENTTLRNRLRDVALSPLSDNEKQQLLFDSHRHHSSAPASIATNIIDDGNGADTTCTTPDWDKHSSSNVSEVSVACLQDKINQMQETHYSTNEELQATLQELTDLQRQLTELQQENERLNEEKTLMFDSLCRQTERLNDSRSEVESLKQLLYQEKDDTGQFESAVEREQKLVDLLKSAQEEREGLLMKLDQLTNELQETRSGIIDKDDHIGHLRERVRTLECTLDAKHAEHKLLDQELAQAKDQCSGKQIEINRLTDLLDNARTKINELEQDRTLSDKSELDELLDNARKEKDSLESEVAHLKEQLAISKNEIEKLKEQVSVLQEECKVTRNNAKTTQSDLEYKCEKLVKDKNSLNEQLQEFQDALNDLQVQSQCQLEDKRQLSAVLSETQRNLSEAERRNLGLENEVDELKRLRSEENEEWEKFQDDLLTSVRVANDFKTEAQQELQRMILENKSYRERERQLKAEIEKLKGGNLKLEADKENMDLLYKRPNRNRNKPRKDSGTVSNSSKSDKSLTLPKNPTVKRRENKSLKAKRLKTLSVEEGILLSSLDSYHRNIDKTLPDEFLTEEEKVIRKLKIIYEDDFLKVKPVAPKPKDQLAISKPLLDSVLTNPKLMAILKDPKVKTVEDIATYEKEAPEIRNLIQDIDRSKKGQSENLGKPEYTKRISLIGRSMSCDHVNRFEDPEGNLRLYRTTEAEDLTQDVNWRESLSLVPSDSASNHKRYSDFSLVVNSNENIIKDNVKYSTLERIVKTIPKNAPEAALTKEQQFALKLLEALEERKRTLKKSEKAKTLPISVPTPDSVLRNDKLKEIIYDPSIQDIRRKSEPLTPPVVEKLARQSKSYENITFNFEDRPHAINVYHSDSESSTETFSSAEFNVETGQTGPFEPISNWTKPAGTPKVPRKMEMTTFGKSSASNDEQKNKIASKMQLLKDELDQLWQPSGLIDNKRHQVQRTEMEPKVGYKEKHKSTTNLDDLKYRHIDDTFKDLVDKRPSPVSKNLDDRKYRQREVHTTRQKDDTFKNRDNSLLYNETLTKKGKTLALEGDYKIDLLQEKIKKKTKKEPGDIKPEENPTNKYKEEIKHETVNNTEDNQIILHVASIETLDSFYSDETDSLTYNETLTRVVSRGTSHMIESKDEATSPPTVDVSLESKNEATSPPTVDVSLESKNEATSPPTVDESIKNISDKLQEIHKMITEDDGKIKPDLILDVDIQKSDEENRFLNKTDDSIVTEVDGSPDQPEDYNYHAILKENRVGVTCPLNHRLSYNHVVNEIRKRFSGTDFKTDGKNEPEAIDGDTSIERESDESLKEIREYASVEREIGNYSEEIDSQEDVQIEIDNKENIEVRKIFIDTDFKSDVKNEHIDGEADVERDIKIYPEEIDGQPDLQTEIENSVKRIDNEANFEIRKRLSDFDFMLEGKNEPNSIDRDGNVERNVHYLPKEIEELINVQRKIDNSSEKLDGQPDVQTDNENVVKKIDEEVNFEVRKRLSGSDFKSESKNEPKPIDVEGNVARDIHVLSKEIQEFTNVPRKIYNFPEELDGQPIVQTDNENTLKNIDDEAVVEIRSRSSSIDKEMDDILESYLHTRVSQLIKQTEGKPSKTIEHTVYSKFDRKLNDIVQSSFNVDDLDSKKSSIDSINHQIKFDNKDIMLSQEFTQITTDEPKEIPYKNLEPELADCALQFEENKAKDYLKLSPTELTFSDDSYFELKEGNVTNIKAGLNTRENINDIVEITNKFIDDQRNISIKYLGGNRNKKTNDFREDKDIEVSSKLVKPVPEQAMVPFKEEGTSILTKNPESTIESPEEESSEPQLSIPTPTGYQILTKEELELVRRSCQRYPRPLSEFNEYDLELVNAISINYEDDTEEIPIKINEDLAIEEQTMDETSESEILLRPKEDPKRPVSNLNQSDLELIDKLTKEYLLNEEKSKNDSERSEDERGEDKEEDLPKKVELPVIKEPLPKPRTTKEITDVNVSSKTDIDIETPKDTPKKLETSRKIDPIPKPRTKKDVSDDLETLLNQMISPRRKVAKKRIIDEKAAPVPETVIESTKKPEVVQDKDFEGFEENNTRSVEDNDSSKKVVDIVIGAEETAKDVNDGIIESIKPVDKGPEDSEKMDKTKLTEHKSDTDDSRANTLRKKREMHVILYRNNKPNNRENVKSLTLSIDDDNATNEFNKNRLSLNLTKSDDDAAAKKEKRVKSFAQHFERISQERTKYAQKKRIELKTFEVKKYLPEVPSIDKSDKKPVPIPRIKNQGTKDPVNDDSYADDKNNEVLRKMSQCEENFSGNDHGNVKKEAEAAGVKFKVNDKVDKVNNEVPSLNESQNLVIDDYSSISTDEDEGDGNSIEDGVIRKSDKFLVDRMPINDDDYLDDTDGAKASYSVIAVAGTAEKLDLRKPSNLTVEPSSLNLFNLDASSLEDHYIDGANASYERRKKLDGTYIGITYSDNDTLESSDSKPKIVDFVPLDEATKPYYKNNHIPDYGTLEREKTYQILNSVSKGKITEAAVDSTVSKSDSRSSFSAAKKIFLDLEAKSDKTGVKKVTITKRQSRDLLDNSEVVCTESTTQKLGVELALEATTKPAQEKIDEI